MKLMDLQKMVIQEVGFLLKIHNRPMGILVLIQYYSNIDMEYDLNNRAK
jgi:hypothetical protein